MIPPIKSVTSSHVITKVFPFLIFNGIFLFLPTVCLNEVGLNGAEKLADGFPGEVNVPRNVLEIYKT